MLDPEPVVVAGELDVWVVAVEVWLVEVVALGELAAGGEELWPLDPQPARVSAAAAASARVRGLDTARP